MFDTTRDTSCGRSDVWSCAWSHGPEGGGGSHEGFPGSCGRVGTFSEFSEFYVWIRAHDLMLFQSALSNFNCTIVLGKPKTMKINKNKN